MAADSRRTSFTGEIEPVTAFLEGNAVAFGYDLSGRYHLKGESAYDLFMAPKTKKGFVNLYWVVSGDLQHASSSVLHSTEEDAVNNVMSFPHRKYMKTIEVEVPA